MTACSSSLWLRGVCVEPALSILFDIQPCLERYTLNLPSCSSSDLEILPVLQVFMSLLVKI